MVAIRRRNRSFQLWLDDNEADKLEELAKARHLSKAELIRTLISENLESFN
jgi:predicted transcriptional regulator